MQSRRAFLKSGLAVGASLSVADLGKLWATTPSDSAPKGPMLVAVRDGERAAMLDRAMAELGGIGKFVQAGQKVVIKPNVSWDVPPERGANTHPELVRRMITLCQEAGAGSVSLIDQPTDRWQSAYASSGVEQVARETGAILVNGKDETIYREVDLPQAVRLKRAKIPAIVLDCDVLINLPILKVHSGTRMTAALKNLMGVVWDRGYYHRNDLNQCIADFATLVRPVLNVLDAYHPMMRNGPRGRSEEDVVVMRSLLASTDMVAIDAAGARMLQLDPAEVRHVVLAAEMGIGRMDLENLDIRRITLA